MYGYGYSYPNNTQGSGLMGNYEAGVRTDGGFFAFPIDTGLASRLEALGLLNASSLVNSCNAGKADVLYNLIPTPVQALDRFTVVRSTVKRVLNSAGVLSEVAINTPAFEFNTDGTYRGLLVEPAGTNGIRNNTNVGAVAGSPGTFPTNWLSNTRGLTRTVVGTGTVNGVEYIDVKYAGTADTTAGVQIGFDGTTQIVASNGQIWTNSFWFQVIAQPTPPINYRLVITERTDVGGAVAGGSSTISTPTVWERYTQTRTLSGGGTVARVTPEFQADVTNGQTYDFTIRIGLPQMEQSSVATSVIKTSGTALTRTADSVTLTGASSLIGQTEGTIYCEVDTRITGGASLDKRIVSLSDGTTGMIIELSKTVTDELKARVVNTTEQASIVTATNRTGVFKLALAYAVNDIAFYVNGVQVGTDALATIPACSAINIGSRVDLNATTFFNDRIRSVVLLPTRLPNATLAALTA